MEQEKPTKPETDRTFPEDDDTLYREMTVHMPRCYFPTSLGENSILKFAGEEFRRVKNIVCRRYNFKRTNISGRTPTYPLSTLFEATSSRKCTDVSVRIMRTSVSSPSEDHLWRKSATP